MSVDGLTERSWQNPDHYVWLDCQKMKLLAESTQVDRLPRKTSRAKATVTVPQTDTGE